MDKILFGQLFVFGQEFVYLFIISRLFFCWNVLEYFASEVLNINNLNVSIEGKKILNDFNITINEGEVHAIMGPNGCGKSTLANVLAGNEDYEVNSGKVIFND